MTLLKSHVVEEATNDMQTGDRGEAYYISEVAEIHMFLDLVEGSICKNSDRNMSEHFAYRSSFEKVTQDILKAATMKAIKIGLRAQLE